MGVVWIGIIVSAHILCQFDLFLWCTVQCSVHFADDMPMQPHLRRWLFPGNFVLLMLLALYRAMMDSCQGLPHVAADCFIYWWVAYVIVVLVPVNFLKLFVLLEILKGTMQLSPQIWLPEKCASALHLLHNWIHARSQPTSSQQTESQFKMASSKPTPSPQNVSPSLSSHCCTAHPTGFTRVKVIYRANRKLFNLHSRTIR